MYKWDTLNKAFIECRSLEISSNDNSIIVHPEDDVLQQRGNKCGNFALFLTGAVRYVFGW